MRRVDGSRRRHVDLLRRRPRLEPVVVVEQSVLGAVRRVDELRELLRLVDRGVLSAEEFERQEQKVFERVPRRRL